MAKLGSINEEPANIHGVYLPRNASSDTARTVAEDDRLSSRLRTIQIPRNEPLASVRYGSVPGRRPYACRGVA